MTGSPKPRNISTKQARIAMLARQMKGTALRTLAHHMDEDWLREAYRQTRKDGARGVDGMDAATFETDLEGNLRTLLDRAKSGLYRAPPVRRVHIPKGEGKTRPLGIPTLEDKVLQRGAKMLLEPIYEGDFYDFSYGFRPRRSAHQALEALHEGIWKMRGGWVLDADIQGFFDAIDHGHLREMLSQRVADRIVQRLVGKWLKAGVMEEGVVIHPESGSPQGGVISPLLANIYLHEVLDRWWVEDVLPRMRGKAFMIRYADDFVMVFSDRTDAERVNGVLPKRLDRYGLTLHPEKTRLIRFRNPTDHPVDNETFDFVGFTLFWGRTRRGKWSLKRKTAKARLSRAMSAMNAWMSRVRHVRVRRQAELLSWKLRGHFNYYGVRGNSHSITRFAHATLGLWKRWLSRRSQRTKMNWENFHKIVRKYDIPRARLPTRPRQLRLANL